MSFGESHLAYTFFYWVAKSTCSVPQPGRSILKHTKKAREPPRPIDEATLSVRLSAHPEYIHVLRRFFYQARRIGLRYTITEQPRVLIRKGLSFFSGGSKDPLCVLCVYGIGPREHVKTAKAYAQDGVKELAVPPKRHSSATPRYPVVRQSARSLPAPSVRVRSTSIRRVSRAGESSEGVVRSAPPERQNPNHIPTLPLEMISLSEEDDDDEGSGARTPSSAASDASSSTSSGTLSDSDSTELTGSDIVISQQAKLTWVEHDLASVSESQSEVASSSSSSLLSSSSTSATQSPPRASVPRFSWLDATVSGEEEESEEEEEEEPDTPRRSRRHRRATTHIPGDLRRIVVLSQARRSSTNTLSGSAQRTKDG